MLGVDVSTVSTWSHQKTDPLPVVEQGGAGRGRKSRIDPQQAVAWYIHRLSKSEDSPLDLNAERARLSRLQADSQELKNSALRKELP